MTIHSDCGKEIRWAQRDDDPERFRPPLEFAGQAYIITEDNIALYVTTYKQHECNPADIKKWFALKRAQAEAKGIPFEDIDDRALAKEEQRKEDWALALTVECPTCKSKKGKKCYNLTKIKRDVVEETKNPHPARMHDWN